MLSDSCVERLKPKGAGQSFLSLWCSAKEDLSFIPHADGYEFTSSRQKHAHETQLEAGGLETGWREKGRSLSVSAPRI